jgi:glycine/D-amino acid oxidase-like deaminating enzyme
MAGSFIDRYGTGAASWLLEASLASMVDMETTVRDGGIDCDFDLGGGLIVSMCPAHLGWWDETLKAASRLGRDDLFEVLGADTARTACGSPRALGGVLIKHAGSVQPALLALGLRRLAVDAGVRVYEASPMTRFTRERPAVIETTGGSVVAERVVLATASWLAAVPELRRTLFVIPSHVVATAPDCKLMDGLGWRHGRPFADARTTVHYGQRTADGRVVFGRGGGRLGFAGRIIPAHFHDEREVEGIAADLRELFPAAAHLPLEWNWGGPVDRAQHGYPWAGTLGRDRAVCYAAGYSGNGVGPSHLMGRILASLALGIDDEYAQAAVVGEPPSYLPPEPVRYVGARTVRAAVKRCEDREERGLAPDPVSRQLRRALGVSMPRRLRLPRAVALKRRSRGG